MCDKKTINVNIPFGGVIGLLMIISVYYLIEINEHLEKLNMTVEKYHDEFIHNVLDKNGGNNE